MSTDFGDLALVEDDESVSAAQRRQPVGNGEGRTAGDESLDRLLQLLLRGRVNGRSRLVENENLRIVKDRPGDGDTLLLAPGELVTALSDNGVVAVRFGDDELVGVGRRCRSQ